mgnify:CR=1 FL=1
MDDLVKTELESNIERLEVTIASNSWDTVYIINCERQLDRYKKQLNDLKGTL